MDEGDDSHGEVRLALMFTPGGGRSGGGTLFVLIKQASCLQNRSTKGLSDPYAKCYLLPDKSAKGKRKTGAIKNNLNPVWEERFTYEKVTLEELSKERVLEVTIWDFNKGSSNERMGGVRLGPTPTKASKHKEWMDSIGDEVSHWEAMLAHPGEWVERWHTLRHSMDPRSVDLAIPPSGSNSSFQQPSHADVTVPAKVNELSTKMEEVAVTYQMPSSIQEVTSTELPHLEPLVLSSNEEREVILPSVQVKAGPSTEVLQTVQVKAEPSLNEIHPPVQVTAELPPKEVVPHVQVIPEQIPEVPVQLNPDLAHVPSAKEIPQPVLHIEPEFKHVPKLVHAEKEVHFCVPT